MSPSGTTAQPSPSGQGASAANEAADGGKSLRKLEKKANDLADAPGRFILLGSLGTLVILALVALCVVLFSRSGLSPFGIALFGVFGFMFSLASGFRLGGWKGAASLRKNLLELVESSDGIVKRQIAATVDWPADMGRREFTSRLAAQSLFTVVFPVVRKVMAKRSLRGKLLSFILGKAEKKLYPRVEADIERKFRAAGRQARDAGSFQGKEGLARLDALAAESMESMRLSIGKILDRGISRSRRSFWVSFISGILALAAIFFFLVR